MRISTRYCHTSDRIAAGSLQDPRNLVQTWKAHAILPCAVMCVSVEVYQVFYITCLSWAVAIAVASNLQHH